MNNINTSNSSVYVKKIEITYGSSGEWGRTVCGIERWVANGSGAECYGQSGWINLPHWQLHQAIPVKANVTYWTGSSYITQPLPQSLAFVDGA
ncbi:hypothetical protein ACQEV2_43145 [Streptomyces sp. CA-251387]|uniref:hypothetical protein n=1 Tax=Streptomyces sp. CA-251387 TaxID=3240064 RepID=UPI003D8BC1E9